MNSKNLLLTTLLLLVLSATVYAQGRPQRGNMPSVEDRVTTIITKMTTELTLSEEQKTSLTDVYTTHFTTMENYMTKGQRPSEEVLEKEKAILDTSVKEVLTTEQFTKYETIKNDLMPGPGSGRGRTGGNY